jgi:hypothetical protein
MIVAAPDVTIVIPDALELTIFPTLPVRQSMVTDAAMVT